MGEFNKDPNQTGTGQDEKGDKTAFGQFDKGQQGQTEFGQEKGEDTGQGKQAFGQDTTQVGKEQTGQQQTTDKTTGAETGQQQTTDKAQRQQGDEDLDEDSKSTIDSQGMK